MQGGYTRKNNNKNNYSNGDSTNRSNGGFNDELLKSANEQQSYVPTWWVDTWRVGDEWMNRWVIDGWMNG